MSAIDLWPEIHAAARNYRPERLNKFRIKSEHALAAGGLGVAKISPNSGGFFEFNGELCAVILPVYWGAIPKKDAPVADWELEDILAFDPRKPDHWWLRRGEAVLLGAGALDRLWLGAELQVRRNPLSWLLNSATGCVVLDWPRAGDRLRSVATLLAEDIKHAQDIRCRLQKPLPIPDIRVPTSALMRAA